MSSAPVALLDNLPAVEAALTPVQLARIAQVTNASLVNMFFQKVKKDMTSPSYLFHRVILSTAASLILAVVRQALKWELGKGIPT